MSSVLEAPAALDLGVDWREGFARLGPSFYTALPAQPLPAPYLVDFNAPLASELGLAEQRLTSAEGIEFLAGSRAAAGTKTLATVYSGHQFGAWAGQLGDGRALLIGEIDTSHGPRELQFKGSGRTPYSRMGDGRAVLRSSIREYLGSEAMHGLGVPTSRALSVAGSPQPVRREEVETAAVVIRTAPSFLRFGHFEHFASQGRDGELRQLADYAIDRYFPQCRASDQFAGNPYANLLAQVVERTAVMVSHWQAVGFCHGVMNTDNMSLLGLTIDYGPFQFLDAFDPGHVCNHSDEQGRYAYNRQPNVAYWNLFCLGQALYTLVGEEDLTLAALEPYKTVFPRELEARMRAKLGLADSREGDRELVERVLQLLAADKVDWTIFWRRLSHAVAQDTPAGVRDLFLDRSGFDAWWATYATRLPSDAGARASAGLQMRGTNPKFVLRNHLAELAIRRAKDQDFAGVAELLRVLHSPFDEHPHHEALAGFPPDWASNIEISCSS